MEAPVDLEQEKVIASRRSVLILDGKVIVAYNTNQPYPQQMSPNPDFPDLRRLHLPLYESNNAPYLCATPASPDYSGALLGQLKQTDHHFPIVLLDGKFKLDPILIESWLSLEKALEVISLALVASALPFFPVDYRFPRAPSAYGFTCAYETRQDAVKAVQKSRDAFQLLIAHIAWGAILHRSRAINSIADGKTNQKEDDSLPPPRPIPTHPKSWMDLSSEDLEGCNEEWKIILRRKHNVHPAYVDALEQSSICDFSIRRSGLVIRKPKDWLYLNFVPILVLANVPIWMVWGDLKAPIPSICWNRTTKGLYGPNSYEVTFAHVWTSSAKTGNQHILPSPPTFPNKHSNSDKTQHQSDNNGRIVKTAYAIRGKSSETQRKHIELSSTELDIFEWIRKRKEGIDRVKHSSTPEQRQRYEQRDLAATKFQMPGKGGATVYEWELDEANNMSRKLVSRVDVPQVWSSYGNKQRWFNCVRNEWELCHDLSPDDTPSDSESEYMDDGWTTPEYVIVGFQDDSETDKPSTFWKERLSGIPPVLLFLHFLDYSF